LLLASVVVPAAARASAVPATAAPATSNAAVKPGAPLRGRVHCRDAKGKFIACRK
jgi:hypothetical protein